MKFILCAAALASAWLAPSQANPWEKEVVYQIFPRSFYDSNGDHIGDFNGISQKLGFLHEMGITVVLINPIFASRVYHNYFADDFLKTDSTLGSNKDFFELVGKAHSLRMKVILDMEVQYVADRHPWYQAVQKDPQSHVADYLWRKGSAFYGQNIHWYDGQKVDIAAINSTNPEVKRAILDVFRYWAAPDGDPSRGVDGFRIDHMMDDLDNKHVMTGMLKNFWLPIEQDIRSQKPHILFLAEQADWGLGSDMFMNGKVDAAYAIPLRFAFMTFDKLKIEKALRDTASATPAGKTQLIFIENHDLERYANAVRSDRDLLRLGAVFNLTAKGTPLIYYGQELGMRGKQLKGVTDGNDIPIRLAYRWKHKIDSKGTADFYRNTGVWTKTGATKDNDGISVEEESGKADSLLNFYKRLIRLRAKTPALQAGSIEIIDTQNPKVLGYDRVLGSQWVTVFLNLSNTPQVISIGLTNRKFPKNPKTGRPFHYGFHELSPHGFAIIDSRNKASE